MSEVTVTIIGGGIVGCALADAAAARGLAPVLIEREAGLGRGTTSRNSEVSHGGMYYPTGSLKAACCVRGRRLLKEFCAAAGVGYRECGKLIVAVTPDEEAELQRLLELGHANGVEDLCLLDRAELGRLEPQVNAVGALLSPRTGILDAEGAARAYAARAAAAGAQVLTGAAVVGLAPDAAGWRVAVAPTDAGRREGWQHTSRVVVNAAGLWSDRIAALAGIDVAARGWELVMSKGNYFSVADRHRGRVGRLVYPVPPAVADTLGVHLCLDLGGGLRLGPDFEPLGPSGAAAAGGGSDEPWWDYAVDPGRAAAFLAGARRFLPWLEAEDLSPAHAGVRPKLCVEGFRDFVVVAESGDLAGLINLVGIDSPGLTSAPALAEHALGLIERCLDL